MMRIRQRTSQLRPTADVSSLLSARLTAKRKAVRRLASTAAALMVAQMLHAPAVQAAEQPPASPANTPIPSVAVKPVSPAKAPAAPAKTTALPAPVWPTAGVAEASLRRSDGGRGHIEGDGISGTVAASQLVQPGGLPVRLIPQPGATPEQVKIHVFDRDATTRAGVRGVLLQATPTHRAGRTGSGSVDIEVNYRTFATAYGGDWATRLRLIAMPECALTTPTAKHCAGTPLPSINDTGRATVSATVPMRGPMLLSVQSGPSGANGDHTATSLQPSSTWAAGSNSGAFTWSYPMRVPPAVGGAVPGVGLSYSSQAVDGLHAATNNQPSWAGEGFNFWPGGYVERRYGSCSDDMDNGANNSVESGDRCWVTDNATISMEGTSGELLYNGADQRWHPRREDGSRIERRTGADNGDNNGEYWVVTNTAGTQFWFGINKLPGWTAGDPTTNSTWTTPIFGNHPASAGLPAEPCHATAFADSDCTQAWRWNLDYVVDVHGNSMSFWYNIEANHYGRNNDPQDAAQYTRDGVLSHITYGTRTDNNIDSVLDVPAPAKVMVTTADRCLADCTNKDAAHWPDTGWDQNCDAAPCYVTAPTYWATKRLASITTQVNSPTGYRDVERWTFTHTFPNPGDGNAGGLWLDKISHTGLVGGTATMPDITFVPVSLDNRVDALGDAALAMARHRIARINTDTGGAIAIQYSTRDCLPGQTMPDPHNNTRRCYPAMWTRQGDQNPTIDWFHKYVVTELREVDMVGGQPSVTYRYSYLGGAAWHYTDDDGLIAEEGKTWSDYRGFGSVTTTVGDGDDVRTHTETRYFRGMHGDKQSTGTRTVNVTDSNLGTWPDEDWYAGAVRETIMFNGPAGPEVSSAINDPWASTATASRTINGITVFARFVNTQTTRSYVAMDGGRPDRITRVTTDFDAYGLPIRVDDLGEDGVSGDEECVKTTFEPRNTAVWLTGLPHQVQTFAVDCSTADTPGSLTEAEVTGVERFHYDGNAYLATPSRGLITTMREASTWNAGNPTFVNVGTSSYDIHGRVIQAADTLNRQTTTAYTPSTGGPVTAVQTTNALNHTYSTIVDPALGMVTATVDSNSKRTEFAYDPLGRLNSVWLPGRNPATETANLSFGYDVRKDTTTSVATRRLNTAGNYVTTYALYDGLLRLVQAQKPSPVGGRIIANTFYDTLGRAWQTYGGYFNADPPSTSLVAPADPLTIPTQHRTLYDGASRDIAYVFRPYDAERWRTTTSYGGDRIDVTAPAGGGASSTFSDARGETIEARQYVGPSPAGAYVSTSYERNRKGQLAAIEDTVGNRWTYTYDLRGRQTRSTDPDRGVTQTFYDNADQITSMIDGRNQRLAFTYDQLGRKAAVYFNLAIGTPLARWTYDTIAKGQPYQSIRIVGGQPYVRQIDGYTDNYQPTSASTIIPASEVGLAGTYTQQATYHLNGQPNSLAWTNTIDLPSETLFHEYNSLGLPTRMLANFDGINTSYVTDTDYNALGHAELYELYTGLYSQTGDKVRLGFSQQTETGRLSRAWVSKDTAPFTVADTSYTYDPIGNITSLKDASSGDNQCFNYDHLRRLTQAWTPANGDCSTAASTTGLGGPEAYWNSWTFDDVGNRTTQTEHGSTGNTTTQYSYPAPGGSRPHTLSSLTVNGGPAMTWSYDAAGNTTSRPGPTGQQTLTWGLEGHLATIKDNTTNTTTTYIYDADGKRLIAKDPTSKTLWIPGQEIHYDVTNATATCTRFYAFNGNVFASRNASGLTWLGSDHQGTAQVAITEIGQQTTIRRQTPFGTPRGNAGTWPNSKGFVGGTSDPTGLTHLGAREYDATTGRFISADPIIDLGDPQQWQGYAYGGNSPITFSDPSGLLEYEQESACFPVCVMVGQNGTVLTITYTWEDGGWQTTVCIFSFCPDSTEADLYQLFWEYDRALGEVGFRADELTFGQEIILMNKACFVDSVKTLGDGKRDTNPACSAFYRQNTLGELSAAWSNLMEAFKSSSSAGFAAALTAFGEAMDEAGVGSCRARAGRGLRASRAGRSQVRPGGRSFDKDTKVLMADGGTKPISELQIGDDVLATDPETGVTTSKKIVAVHLNLDTELADVTIVEQDGDRAVIQTSQNHPFWNETTHTWTDAGQLTSGDTLSSTLSTPTVAEVERFSGSEWMYDLTVEDIHTYYVLAGETPVLVHNTRCRTFGALSPSGRMDIPNTSGVYRIEMNDGKVYIGKASDIHGRIHAAFREGGALAGTNPNQVRGLDWMEMENDDGPDLFMTEHEWMEYNGGKSMLANRRNSPGAKM